jgi:hypothetical protein
VAQLLGVAGAVERADAEGEGGEEGCGEPVGLAEGELGADARGVAVGGSDSAPEAVGSLDPRANDGSAVLEGDEDCAEEGPALLLAAALGVPGALTLLLPLGRALRVAEAVRHAPALPVGGAVREPRSGEKLAGAEGAASSLGDAALLADGGLLPRASGVARALEEGAGKAEAFGETLWLPEDEPEGAALRDGSGDARGEGLPPSLSDCSAVPLCAKEGAVLSVARLLEGEGEGPLLPVATEAKGSPLTLGEPVADCDAAVDGDGEGDDGAEREPDAEGDAACDAERGADCDRRPDAAGVDESPESVGCAGDSVEKKDAVAVADAALEERAAADAVARGVSRADCEPVEDALDPVDTVCEAHGDEDAPAEGDGGLGDTVAPPVAVFAKTESVGRTVCGKTLLVGVAVPDGGPLKRALSLAASDGSPLPLPGGLKEGCDALAEELLQGDAAASALAALLPLLGGDSRAVEEWLAVAAGDGVAAPLPVPSGELEKGAEALSLIVAPPVGTLLAEGWPEALPETSAVKEASPVELGGRVADGSPLEAPLAVVAQLPLGALPQAEGDAGALPSGDAVAHALHVPPSALSEGGGEPLRQALCVK